MGYNIFCTKADHVKCCTEINRRRTIFFFFNVRDTHCIKGPPEWKQSCPYEELPKRPNIRPSPQISIKYKTKK